MAKRVRPITVMAATAVLVVVLVGVFALRRDDATVLGQPATIPVALGVRAEASATTLSGSPTYVRGQDLDEPADSQAAWVVAATEPEPAAVRRLAEALGVTGDLRQVDGMWQIGADDGPNLKVQTSAGLAWDYSSGATPAVATACAEPATRPTVPQTANASDLPASPTTTANAGRSAGDSCISTPPLEGVPSVAEAEDATRDLLRRAGMDIGHLDVSATSDEWGARATATPELGGTATQGIDTLVGFGAEGAITHASGALGVATRGDVYPLLGIDAAIARLNAGRDVLDGYPLVPMAGNGVAVASDAPQAVSGPSDGPESIAGSTVTTVPVTTVPEPDTTLSCTEPLSGEVSVPPATGAPATTTTIAGAGTTITGAGDGDAGGSSSGPTGCSGEISPCAPCPVDAICADICRFPTCDPAACTDPHPGPTVVPDPADDPSAPDVSTATTVTITSVEVVLSAVRGTDGAIWLVPAYRFGADGHGTTTVLAIDESFIAPASGPAIEPATDPTSAITTGTRQTIPPASPPAVPDDACCPPTLQADGSVVQCMMACSAGSSATVTSTGG